MNNIAKIITLGSCLTIGGLTYGASTSNMGVASFKDHKTMQEIKKNCPDYKQTQNGRCLGSSFRSVYLIRGGSFTGK